MTGNPAAPGAGGFPIGVGQFLVPGGSVTSNVYTQLAFDPRMNKQALINRSTTGAIGANGKYRFVTETGLARGFIVQAMSQAQGDGALYGCAFLFNPSIVTLQHGLDSNATSLTLPQYRRLSSDTGVYLVGLASTLDVSLFFDRTYEVNTAAENNGAYSRYGPLGFLPETQYEASQILINDDPRLIGCQADIKALYRVCGMTDPIPGVTWTNDAVNGQTATSSTVTLTGPMQQVPCYLMLGASMGMNTPFWYGYIDSLSITYTHFTQAMVPMRAQVDIEMTLLPDATAASAAAPTTTGLATPSITPTLNPGL